MERIKDVFSRFAPKGGASSGGFGRQSGVGSGGHAVVFENEMIVPKSTIVFHTSQILFNFLAMCCFASAASFQTKWDVGPSFLSAFALFVSILGIIVSAFMLLIPFFYEKYDKFATLARALKEMRVAFILTGVGTGLALLIAFITTISAFTQAGCKDASKDPNADIGGDDEDKSEAFQKGLGGFCSTKKAGAIFFWLATVFWLATLGFLIKDWRSGKLGHGGSGGGPRDPPFQHPPSMHGGGDSYGGQDDDDDEESRIPPVRRPTDTAYGGAGYDTSNTQPGSPFADRYSSVAPHTASYASSGGIASRPSMDAYGAFNDPTPSGYGAGTTPGGYPAQSPPASGGYQSTFPGANAGSSFGGANEGPRVSRTMQYADPYAAVRASISGAPVGAPPAAAGGPPGYDSYNSGGFR